MSETSQIRVRAVVAPKAPRKRKRRQAVKPEGFTFIDFDSSADPASTIKQRRREIRTLAAFACAGARKATIAKRVGSKGSSPDSSSVGSSSPTETHATRHISAKEEHGTEPDVLQHVLEFVTRSTSQQDWWAGPIERSALAHKAIRTLLWTSIVSNPTLFQSATFVSSTHSNSCGLHSNTFNHGVGVLLLRGASFEAVHAAVMAGADSMTPVSVAMLAGWERKFGDRDSYATHMLAWQSMQLPCDALHDSHVSTLIDVTFETFREALGSRSLITHSTDLPSGLMLFKNDRPESRSLLDIASQMHAHKPDSPGAVLGARGIGIENIAWSPYHTESISPNKELEDSWDPIELNALYHLRACMISISALQLAESCKAHKTSWMWDWRTGITVHTVSCQHLRTEELLDTPFAELAVWSRFTMCATSRDPDRDDSIRNILQHLGIISWSQLYAILKKHLYDETLFGQSCFDFYQLLYGD